MDCLREAVRLTQQAPRQVEALRRFGVARTGHLTYMYNSLRHLSRCTSLMPVPRCPLKFEVIFCVQGVISPLLSNIMLHEVDRQWCRGDGTMSHSVVLVRYADDMVLLARTEPEARQAWERLQNQFAALRLVVNQEKSRLTTVGEGFAFLGFEFRKPLRRAVHVAAQEGVPTYPGSGARGGPIVSQ